MVFDTTMTLEKHVNVLVKSSFFHLRNIAKVRKYLSYETSRILVQSFVCSKIDNCNALLYGLPKYLMEKLQSVQNAAARVIARVGKYEHITPVLHELHWLPVEYRILFKINLLTFKCLHDSAPCYLEELLETYKPTRSLRSSSAPLKLKPVKYNMMNYGLRSFAVHAPLLWNELPENVRLSDSLSLFKV